MRPALPTGTYILGGNDSYRSKAVVYTGSTPCGCCGGIPTRCCCDPYGAGTGSGFEYGQPDFINLTVSVISQSGGLVDYIGGSYRLRAAVTYPCGAWQYIGLANNPNICSFDQNGPVIINYQVICEPTLTPSCNNLVFNSEINVATGGEILGIPISLFPPCSCNPFSGTWRFTLNYDPSRGIYGLPCPTVPSPPSGWFINYQAQATI